MNEQFSAPRGEAYEESFIKKIFDALPGAVGYWDTDLICRFASAAIFDWFGRAPEAALGTHYRDLVNEDFFRANEPYIRAALAGAKQCFERTVPKADGSTRYLLVDYIPDIDDAGAVAGFFVNVSDVTVVKLSEAQLEVAAAVFDHAADGIFVTDAAGTILSVNPAFTEITGYTAAEAVGQNPRILNSARQGPEFFAALWHQLKTCGRWQGEIWNRRKNGEIFFERQTITKVRNSSGEAVRYVSVFSDITEAWRRNERFRHLAFHDELTDLPNRTAFTKRLNEAVLLAQRERQCLAVMFIDLDGFKAVNDRLGHEVGDALLKSVARKLQALVRSTDIVARIGGDEFIVLIGDAPSELQVARIAAAMIEAINEPLNHEGTVADVGVSIGIARYPADGRSAADLVQRADAAMYGAKATGKNAYCFARPPVAEQTA